MQEKDRPFGNTGDENTLTSAIPSQATKHEAEGAPHTTGTDEEHEHVAPKGQRLPDDAP